MDVLVFYIQRYSFNSWNLMNNNVEVKFYVVEKHEKKLETL